MSSADGSESVRSVEGGVRSDLPSDGGRTPRPNRSARIACPGGKVTTPPGEYGVCPTCGVRSYTTREGYPQVHARRPLEPVCPWCSVFIVDGEDREPFNGRLFHTGCLSDMQTRDIEDVWG